VALARQAVETIIREAPAERELLAEKMRRIANGEYTQGDIRNEAGCGLAAGITIGSALSSFFFGIGFGIGPL
jgi:hypothetical protein